ncbi:CHAP domain-containing protein [Amycolatopsis sp. NPDC049159]|uniref:CHAP domain-containing protein n=1 Tax=Amycolatopsis sp. NPDC049159 TaxID=3157210 RepID=UPI0033C94717
MTDKHGFLLRRVLSLTALLFLMSAALAGTSSATGTTLCSGYGGCASAGRSDSGYSGSAGTSYWGMYPGHNCTNYAAYRLIRNGVDASYLRGHGNAYEWGGQAQAHGVAVNGTPAVGAVAWWAANSNGSGSLGHVAYVEEVGNGYILTSEDNYGGDFHWVRLTPGGYYPTGFIHFRDISPSVGDGTFVNYAGNVYRIAGGAPLYVSTWSAFGGTQPTVALNQAQFDSLRQQPADGTFVTGAQTGQVYRIVGGAPLYVSTWSAFGGTQPTTVVDQATLDNAGAGSVWNHLRYQPADGTFVTGGQTGQVYRFAGGAPLYVSTWSAFGGTQPTTVVDQAALDNGDAGSVWNHTRYRPADGTFVTGGQSGQVYRITGGAPVYVSAWSAFGGTQPTTVVDQAALDNGDAGSVWNHLRYQPADGTFVNGGQTGQVYRITGGAPLYVSTWSAFGGNQPYTTIDQGAIENASAGGVWNHLRYRPADGTFVTGAQTGQVYRFAGGAPLYVSTWSAFGGTQPTTVVDQAALDNGDLGGVWSHTRYRPADGTFVSGGQTGRPYRVSGGHAAVVDDWSPYGGVQPTTAVDQAAIDNAGAGGVWNHLIP